MYLANQISVLGVFGQTVHNHNPLTECLQPREAAINFAMSQPILLQNANCTTRLRLLESRGLVDLDEVWLRRLDAVDSSRVVRQHDAHLR